MNYLQSALQFERIKADAKSIFTKPGRLSRPEKIVVILRGLPGTFLCASIICNLLLGSGKTYYAKILKDLEEKHGGTAPRIFCVDDYFMAV